MHRRCASWHAVPLHTFVCLTRQRRARHKVLHKNAFSDEALFRFTPQYEASSFHSDMKHSAHAPYDLSSIALRATDDEKMKNESYVCKYSSSMLHYSAERKNLSWKNRQTNLSIFLFFCILNAAFTWCGWHYRMELRDRYAVVSSGVPGWKESGRNKVYNINLMPADIRR